MNYEPGDDLYIVLGISPTATEPEIRAAHRRVVLATHADRTGDETSRTTAKANVARDLLCNPQLRAEYDAARSLWIASRLPPMAPAAAVGMPAPGPIPNFKFGGTEGFIDRLEWYVDPNQPPHAGLAFTRGVLLGLDVFATLFGNKRQ